MNQHDWMAEQFEAHRQRLRTVAYRMLGSQSEADDAVQETWLRLSRADTSGVENLGSWLTTVVGRVCLDMLRSRKSRREHPLDTTVIEPAADPEHEAVMADSIGLALLVVLETLSPAERVAFVLHDMFAMPFEDIAPIVGRSEVATRQLASRARRRVRGAWRAQNPHDSERRGKGRHECGRADHERREGQLATVAPEPERRQRRAKHQHFDHQDLTVTRANQRCAEMRVCEGQQEPGADRRRKRAERVAPKVSVRRQDEGGNPADP